MDLNDFTLNEIYIIESAGWNENSLICLMKRFINEKNISDDLEEFLFKTMKSEK